MKTKRFLSKPVLLGVTVAVAAGLLGFSIFNFLVYHKNPVVLEVTTVCRGLTYPRGSVLEFRLHQDGRLEYVAYPPDERSAGSHIRYWFPRTHSYITPAEVNELITTAQRPDFLAAEHQYPPAIPGLDSEFRTSILFSHAGQKKNIVVVDYLGDDGVNAKERLPTIVVGVVEKGIFDETQTIMTAVQQSVARTARWHVSQVINSFSLRVDRGPQLKASVRRLAGVCLVSIDWRASMSHGKICYLEIPAITAEASARFYSSIFGWTVRKRADGELAFDDTGGVSGTWVKESDRTPDERTRIYIMVDDISDTLKKIEAAGGTVLTPRTDIAPGSGAFAVFADPVGTEFGIYEEPKR